MEVLYVLYRCCIVERDKAPNKPEGRSTVLLLALTCVHKPFTMEVTAA